MEPDTTASRQRPRRYNGGFAIYFFPCLFLGDSTKSPCPRITPCTSLSIPLNTKANEGLVAARVSNPPATRFYKTDTMN